MPHTEKLAQASADHAATSTVRSQPQKILELKALGHHGMLSNVWNSTWSCRCFNIYLTKQTKNFKPLQWKILWEKELAAPASKVLIFEGFFQMSAKCWGCSSCANNWDSSPEMIVRSDFIQYLLGTYNIPDPLAWGNPFLWTWQTPEAVALGFCITHLNAKFLGASERLYFCWAITAITWSDFTENNAIYFPSSLAIFRSCVTCVLQNSGQSQEAESQRSLNSLRTKRPRLCAQGMLDLLGRMPWLNKCSKTSSSGRV